MTNNSILQIVSVVVVVALFFCAAEQFYFNRKLTDEQRSKLRTLDSNRYRIISIVILGVVAFFFPSGARLFTFLFGVCILTVLFEDSRLKKLTSTGLELQVINRVRIRTAAVLLTIASFILALYLFGE